MAEDAPGLTKCAVSSMGWGSRGWACDVAILGVSEVLTIGALWERESARELMELMRNFFREATSMAEG